MAETCVMTSDNAIYINLYTEAEITLENGTKVVIEGDYLADSKAKIAIDFSGNPPCEVKLRIPSWSDRNKVIVDGVEYNPDCGYFSVNPENKITIIEVQFDDSIKIIEKDAYKDIPNTDVQYRKWTYLNTIAECTPDMLVNENRCILQKGTILLCRTKLIGNTEEEMFGGKTIDTSYKCTFTKVKPAKGINIQFDITLENEYNKIVTGVCDYASGTNMMFDDMHTFSIFF